MTDLKILIVEDESIVAMDLQHRLENHGYQVIGQAVNGASAIRQASALHPDVILMDIQLKGDIDGIETAALIREDNNIPVIFLTAFADKQTLERARVTEAFGYILKPYHERELFTNIEMAVYKHNAEEKLRQSERWLNTSMNSISDGVVTSDFDDRVQFMNYAAESLLGLSFGDVDGEKLEPILSRLITKGDEKSSFKADYFIKRGTQRIPVEINETDLHDRNGSRLGRVVVFRNISERYLYEQALHQAKETAEKASTAKSDFLATVSHELRTPLNSILGMSELIRDATSDEEILENLDIIHSAGTILLSVINSMLNFSGLKNGTKEDSKTVQEFSLSDSARQVMDRYTGIASRKNITFSVNLLADTPIKVWGDEDAFLEILGQFIDNAFKFTETGEIQVRIFRDCNVEEQHDTSGIWLHVSVQDTGIGMDPDLQLLVFEPFSQACDLYTRTHNGAGLGLAIAKQKVEVLGGNVWVESRKNEGSTFHVLLPFLCEDMKDCSDDEISFHFKGREIFEEGFNSGLNDFLLKAEGAVKTGDLAEIEKTANHLKNQLEGHKMNSEHQVLMKIILASRRNDFQMVKTLLTEFRSLNDGK